MYPIRGGYSTAIQRVSNLRKNGHDAEALLASVFMFEKSTRRILRFCGLSRGFTSKQCDQLFNNMGFRNMKEVWPCFERDHKTLPECVGMAHWQYVNPSVAMRNKMAHGERVYNLSACSDHADKMLRAVESIRDFGIQEYSIDCWNALPSRRKSLLGWDTMRSNISSK